LVSMLHHYYDQREKVFESQTSTSWSQSADVLENEQQSQVHSQESKAEWNTQTSPWSAPKTDDTTQPTGAQGPKDIDFGWKKIRWYPYKHGDCGPAMILDTLSFLGIPPKHGSVDEVRQVAAPW
jgi:hypothetical protein